jgi:hypothetical protein
MNHPLIWLGLIAPFAVLLANKFPRVVTGAGYVWLGLFAIGVIIVIASL